MTREDGPSSPAPINHPEPWTHTVRVDGRVEVLWREGPATGLAWGTEHARLHLLLEAEWADERSATGTEWAQGYAAGQAMAKREAARDLIERAWWQA